jgi:hypothetical protein
MESQNDEQLMQKLCEAFIHKQYSELEANTTLEILKKEVHKGIIEIGNKKIRPTP